MSAFHISVDKEVADGFVFVDDDEMGWEMISAEDAARLGKKPILCACCDKPATSIDCHYPHFTDHNRCKEHALK